VSISHLSIRMILAYFSKDNIQKQSYNLDFVYTSKWFLDLVDVSEECIRCIETEKKFWDTNLNFWRCSVRV